ncbi:hypothetical protein [Aestuariivivens sediminis]|uniref:hypothetical protein n=1 Tax=Aestuariivivens sediminis TaxID=2913557 RepID=UPI001F59C6BA|nr:hypothetical protein [Aestuariivivens sediminis]
MFKQRRHKTFKYKPRFIKNKEDESHLNASKETDFIPKWKEAQARGKRKFKGGMKLSILILLLVLLLLCMYLLDKKYM